jgi:hypothetical protein
VGKTWLGDTNEPDRQNKSEAWRERWEWGGVEDKFGPGLETKTEEERVQMWRRGGQNEKEPVWEIKFEEGTTRILVGLI